VECGGLTDLHKAIAQHQPSLIIYNYHPSTMPWITQKIVHTWHRSLIKDIQLPQVGIIHEVTQEKADMVTDDLFDYYIAADPTLLLKNPLVFKTGRLIPVYNNSYPLPEVPAIGSFGFATPNKGFEAIVTAVQEDFDRAVLRFNIPSADFGDKDGSRAHQLADACRRLITKPGIELNVTHDFLSREQILDFLAQNTANVFLYQDKGGRGLSSTVDYALAVERPVVVSDSPMFRHLHQVEPSVVYGRNSIKQVIQNGFEPLRPLRNEWDAAHLVWEYERIADAILKREEQKKNTPGRGPWKQFKTRIRKLLGRGQAHSVWLSNSKAVTEDSLSVDRTLTYTPVNLPAGSVLNRILDNKARALYRPAIDKLVQLVPLTMAKKIPEANVQQAFIFDTVYRFSRQYAQPRMLCVGSYEDTAAMSLRSMGFSVEEIDPVINYYLQEYYSKPGVAKESFDVIFSTSVIEHDPDDVSFAQCIAGLLAPGGVAVITCDFKEGWKPGDPKPAVDARLYTQDDLLKRLLPNMPGCELVDEPQWDCPEPDFIFETYRYTFASLVVKKSK
jgi:SAM-dependent methyltransferase